MNYIFKTIDLFKGLWLNYNMKTVWISYVLKCIPEVQIQSKIIM
jgi:hypothetical protein